jgi:hypothetical protein
MVRRFRTLTIWHYDVPLAANDSTTLTLGITLDAADVLDVAAGDANAISVNVFGTEITA